MIRDRRPEDLDRLCGILDEVEGVAEVLAGRERRDWLTETTAERSWVFDQAPVTVAPTKNVVGHVQIYRPHPADWIDDLAANVRHPVGDVRVIGRLFVRPAKHSHGIARYLLRESVSYVEKQNCLAVIDPESLTLIPTGLIAKLGFAEVPVGDAAVPVLMARRPG